MELNELFKSYNNVDPVSFVNSETLYETMYPNLERAQQISSNYKNWKTGTHSSDINYKHWKTKINLNSDNLDELFNSNFENLNSEYDDINYFNERFIKDVKSLDKNRVKFWFNQFKNLGFNENLSIAIVVAMNEECRLDPKGKVNELEFKGKGNTEKGWAGAGEGTIGITHWNTKERLIKLFNTDSRRKGEKLPETKKEYIKDNSKHICDLSDEDAALITAIYYDELKLHNLFNFKDTVADFYLSKAGSGGSALQIQTSLYDKAVAHAKDYQKTHYEQGHLNSSKINKFLMSLRIAEYIRDNIIK